MISLRGGQGGTRVLKWDSQLRPLARGRRKRHRETWTSSNQAMQRGPLLNRRPSSRPIVIRDHPRVNGPLPGGPLPRRRWNTFSLVTFVRSLRRRSAGTARETHAKTICASAAAIAATAAPAKNRAVFPSPNKNRERFHSAASRSAGIGAVPRPAVFSLATPGKPQA
jgi:hypothetical protein